MPLKLDFDEWTPYVPVYGGNRELSEPMSVEVRALRYGDVLRYAEAIRAARLTGGERAGREAEGEVQRRQFCENVRNVLGLVLNGREVAGPEEVYDRAPFGLVRELLSVMEDVSMLSEGERKNSDARCAGSPVQPTATQAGSVTGA